jgi:Domain of unknown function (DU1801)
MPARPFADPAVAAVFDAWPTPLRRKLLLLRELIFKTAESLVRVGPLEETLKWGEPAYLTAHSKSGSTIRISWKKSTPTQYAIYFLCQTNLVDGFRTLFPQGLKFEGNRAIVFNESDDFPRDAVALCIGRALTYHLRARRRSV